VLVSYCLPGDPAPCTVPAGAPYSLMHTQTQDGPDAATASYRNSWAFVDGLGRTVATLDEADPSAGDAGQWIVNGLTSYDAKGAAQRAYLAWFWNGAPSAFPLGTVPTSPYGRQRDDAFGRQLQTFALDGSISLQSVYHALSVDKWDAADLSPGPHQGTPASATQDGHGRTIAVTERVHGSGGIEAHETRTTYLSTGEPVVITRVNDATGEQVTRTLQYDTLGRMVLNVEPDTSTATHAWRYAYDDNGDLVGTSDARGCGANYAYDVGGRIVSEDFSPCLLSQQPYSAPQPNGDGTEAYYEYDGLDPDSASIPPSLPINGALLLGRLVAVADRGAKTVTSYDGRGRVLGLARRMGAPGTPSDTLESRYAPHWYVQTTSYDGADRPVASTTGVDVPELLDSTGNSVVTTAYSKRGTVSRVGSGYGPLVTGITRAADGLVGQIGYGDLAGTTSVFNYDTRRRLSSVQTYRGPPAMWATEPPDPLGASDNTFQLLLQDLSYSYDAVDNPTTIRDGRNPAEWPSGAQPVTRQIQYDDLYRVTNVAYSYPAGSDTWVSPFDAEDKGIDPDPRRAQPSPHVSFMSRVMSQSFQYDWLGNTTATDDDAHGFYDRSLGTVTNGTASKGPYQLLAAQGVAGSARGGGLTAAYDDAGNMTSLTVARSGPCLPSGANCSQRFVYDWDEVGRLVDARRWDSVGGSASDSMPIGSPTAELEYAYDASDQRTLKTAVGAAQSGVDAQTVYVFGALELRRTTWDGDAYDYERNDATEVGYLDAHGVRMARLHYALDSVPTASSGALHVLLELPDHLGSTSIVIDLGTSELVEATTYLPYGGDESSYRPVKWGSFREDYAFTRKEQDVELGLEYFGKRVLVQALGRWACADPLATQTLLADLNPYAYVHGRLLAAVDRTGLADDPAKGVSFCATASCTQDQEQSTQAYKQPDAGDHFAKNGGASWGRSVPSPSPSGPNASIQPPRDPDAPFGLRLDDPTEAGPAWVRPHHIVNENAYNPDAYGFAPSWAPPTKVYTPTEGEKKDDQIKAFATLGMLALDLPEIGAPETPLARLPRWTEKAPARGILAYGPEEVPLASGAAGPGQALKKLPGGPGTGLNAQIPTHVEGHAAGLMHTEGITDADLFINKAPCASGAMCRYNLNKILPPGSTLRVHFLEENGTVTTWTFHGGVPGWWPFGWQPLGK
ncbi:MAG: DddA-like double-stranded DNA deaminase toxin, partial [Polyangiaceae bacterium]